jgi:hypothetical protein
MIENYTTSWQAAISKWYKINLPDMESINV